MADETKLVDQPEAKPAGDAPVNPPAPNPGPSADELLKQKQELEAALKEKDAKIADLETTRATIEARQRQIEEEKAKRTTDADLQKRITQINDRRAYDPEGADAEMASLLTEVQSKAAERAVSQAQGVIAQQTAIEKIKQGVKSSNPDFDDDIVEDIMHRANRLATTGKYKTADEAVKAATDFVRSKFDSYAQKKNAAPPLPPGARAEGGGANNPPPPPPPETVKSAEDEINEAIEAKNKRLI